MKIITALNNEKINNKLKYKINNKIIHSDIQYQEGIFEVMEKIKNVDFIIINDNLPGKLNFNEFIELLIKKKYSSKYIVILNKKDVEREIFLNSKKIFNILYNNKLIIDNLINLLNNKNINNENKINLKNKLKILKNIFNNKIIKLIKNKIKKEKLIKNNKIITFIGNKGSGKTIILIIFSLILNNKKILLIDFNINSDLRNIIYIKNINKKINNEKIRINKNINLILNKNNNFNNIKDIKELIEDSINKYDYIFIDGINENLSENNKIIMELSNINFLIVEPNVLELKKVRNLLNNYINKYNIKKEKINIIFNKVNINSIDYSLLNNLFSEFSIIGKINYSSFYNLIINSNLKIIPKKIKKEYKKIINKI